MEDLDEIYGKYFSMIEEENSITVIYKINRNETGDGSKYTIERIESTIEFLNNEKKRTFFVDNPAPDGNHLLIFTFKDGKVIFNSAFLDYDSVIISKKKIELNMKILYNEENTEYREFYYTPDLKRQIAIIDIVTADEVKPTVYIDKETKRLKGKFLLKPNKKYFAFEIKEKSNNI